MTDERETLTYELFGTASRELAQQVVDDGYEPDLILSIARGGLFLAGSLGYALDVKNLFVMNVEFYTGVDERLDLPVVLPPTLDRVDLTGARVLVADDVADTGKTLELVRDFCSGTSPRCGRRSSTRSRSRSCVVTTCGGGPTAGSTFRGRHCRRSAAARAHRATDRSARMASSAVARRPGTKAAAVGSPPPPPSLRSLR
ncbi:MAG: Xanthine phosphoribosyltransferase [Blastococcus sp.]|nr:Xanthine phosphoribosyltransferase [Blastococcus sp.]